MRDDLMKMKETSKIDVSRGMNSVSFSQKLAGNMLMPTFTYKESQHKQSPTMLNNTENLHNQIKDKLIDSAKKSGSLKKIENYENKQPMLDSQKLKHRPSAISLKKGIPNLTKTMTCGLYKGNSFMKRGSFMKRVDETARLDTMDFLLPNLSPKNIDVHSENSFTDKLLDPSPTINNNKSANIEVSYSMNKNNNRRNKILFFKQ